jgi:hypothetical protein
MVKQIDWNGLKLTDLKNKIQYVLWHDWDPIGINGDHALREYDSFVPEIVVILFNGIDIKMELDAYFKWAVHDHMGLSEYDNFHQQNNVMVINKILKIGDSFKKENCD